MENTVKRENQKRPVWFLVYMLVLLLVILIFKILYMLCYIPSGSMEPTIKEHDWVVADRTAYKELPFCGDREPQRGDIVIFWSEEEQLHMVKRVIGLPGDTVVLSGGNVYVNGEKLDESAYIEKGVITDPGDNGKEVYAVPEGKVFLMGDNRENSFDSRYWEEPFIHERDIRAKVVKIVPFHKLPWYQNSRMVTQDAETT